MLALVVLLAMAVRTRALADEEAPNGGGELLPGELVPVVEEPPPPKHMSGNMVGLGFGLAVGGDPLVAAEYVNGEERRITAAGGAEFAVTFAMTPLWAGVLGFGVSGELGWKLQLVAATNGEVMLTRVPAVATAHMMAKAVEGHYVAVVAGIQHDFGIGFDASGVGQVPPYSLQSGLGLLAGLGYEYLFTERFSFDCRLRFVKLDYTAHAGSESATVKANHFSFLLGASYIFGGASGVSP